MNSPIVGISYFPLKKKNHTHTITINNILTDDSISESICNQSRSLMSDGAMFVTTVEVVRIEGIGVSIIDYPTYVMRSEIGMVTDG